VLRLPDALPDACSFDRCLVIIARYRGSKDYTNSFAVTNLPDVLRVDIIRIPP
jgi:hypothetical protein